ncbi:MAG: hypothetical protein MK226_22950 [Saprospiraceae bacterium]|nr:hypothetical protein [Saprospiraceae bacterium]
MKSLFNPPKDRGFFDVYATLAQSVNRSGYFAQLISAATEIGIIYSLAKNSLIDFFPQYAEVFAVITAIIGTATIEIGLRLTTPHTVDAILYKRFKGLYLPMSIAIFILTAVLLGSSGYLSFSNSDEIVHNFTPEAKQITTANADSIYLAETEAATNQFRNDTSLINSNYQSLIGATSKAYAAKIAAAESEVKKWIDKEQATGRNYTTHKANAEVKKAETIAERDGIISNYKADQTAKIAAAKANYSVLIKEARKIKKTSLAEVKATNKQAKADRETKVSSYGGGLGWFTIVCLFLFVSSVVLDRIHKKGSGIEEKIQLSQYDISPSAWNEFLFAIRERLGYNLRSWIFDFAAATPPPPLPVNNSELYDQTELTDNITKLKTQETEKRDNVIHLPSRRRIGFRTDQSYRSFYSTPSTKHENTKTTHETPEMREIKQRLKMYKKRLGSHQQKALAQEKKYGKIKQRTKDAIDNNRNWITHYTNLLNQPK